MSDNGPQYDSNDMKDFASTYKSQHVASTLYYPQSNRMAKRKLNLYWNMQ